ncbi:MAG: DUF1700 domain-containing protein [Bacteroidia bacterium]|nr:DUF1700 domain-containing protein [Bacteroidia bacterium]
MKKNEFISKLRQEIRNLPYDEVEKTIAYYEEIISDRMEDGSSEDDAVASLGTPEAIARDLLANQSFSTIIRHKVEDYKKKSNPDNTVAIIVIMVLLFPVWFPIVMGVFSFIVSFFAVVGAVIVALWSISVAIGAAGIALIIASVFGFATALIPTGFFSFGTGIALIGLAILAIIASVYATKGIIKLLGLLIHSVKKLFVRSN